MIEPPEVRKIYAVRYFGTDRDGDRIRYDEWDNLMLVEEIYLLARGWYAKGPEIDRESIIHDEDDRMAVHDSMIREGHITLEEVPIETWLAARLAGRWEEEEEPA